MVLAAAAAIDLLISSSDGGTGRLEYRQETLNYGEFALQADGRHLSGDSQASGGSVDSLGYARDASSGRFTLRNLGFPLTTQTFAHSAVGDIYSELTEGIGRNYRLSLGRARERWPHRHFFRTLSAFQAIR